MIIIDEGDNKDIAVSIARTRATGAIALTVPQRRILDSQRNLTSSSFDWTSTDVGGAVWDDVNSEIYTLFQSTSTSLSTPGFYYVQLRGTIGTEIYTKEVIVQVKEIGP